MVLVAAFAVVMDMDMVAEIVEIFSHINSMVLTLITLGILTTKVRITLITTL